MTTTSTILDGNAFRLGADSTVSAEVAALVGRRERLLGPSYRLFYADPVHAVRATGCHLVDAEGNDYLDMYNNVVSVGHCHPRVVAAVHEQMQRLNTHTRYLQDGILDYAEDLVGTLPAPIGTVMFTCSGSEANDLAVRVARHHTGGRGVVVTSEAYHGTTDLIAGLSPAMGAGYPLDPAVRAVPAPDAYRVRADDLGAWFADRVRAEFDDLLRHGIRPAAFLADSIFASDGVLPDPAGFLAPVLEVVHRYGAVYIADEVQPGFGRTGAGMWGFARHGIVPDLVTMGKPMGNGVPVAAMAARPEVLAEFGRDVPYFNTFGGNPVSIAAAQAVLDVIRDEGLIEHAASVGGRLLAELRLLSARHPAVGDVRGAGLFVGVELVDPDGAPDARLALAVVNDLRERHVLTSVCGPGNNVLKIRPPFAFSDNDVERFVTELDRSLASLEEKVS